MDGPKGLVWYRNYYYFYKFLVFPTIRRRLLHNGFEMCEKNRFAVHNILSGKLKNWENSKILDWSFYNLQQFDWWFTFRITDLIYMFWISCQALRLPKIARRTNLAEEPWIALIRFLMGTTLEYNLKCNYT